MVVLEQADGRECEVIWGKGAAPAGQGARSDVGWDMLKLIRRFRQKRLLRSLFDREYYLSRYPDVARAGMDPLRHYMRHGWTEGRDPSPHFNTNFYLKRYPDVAASGMNPLLHFLNHGQQEGRIATPESGASRQRDSQDAKALQDQHKRVVESNIDREYYYATYPDVRDAGLDPADHYYRFGWKEGRNPNRDFNTDYYISENPDVAVSGINPFVHYVLHGRDEGRIASSPLLDLIALKPVASPWQSPGILTHACDMSVVIPTYNRARMLPSLLDSWRAVHKHSSYSFEIIFSDDGSEDETLDILEAEKDLPIRIVRNNHGGAAAARNAAVRAARGRKILFMGDDIFPAPSIIDRHVEKLRELPVTDAVLGFCDWHPDVEINHLMVHITEIGCEQFSFVHLPKDEYTDFRHFYTCNVSIDREFLLSEERTFDEAFYKVNFEDAELGYRLAQKGMRIYYYPEAYGDHLHPYHDVSRFCVRQEVAGEMAIVFERLHPEVKQMIPLDAITKKWMPYLSDLQGPSLDYDFYGNVQASCQQIEGSKALEDEGVRRSLSTVYSTLFRFAFEKGFIQNRVEGFTDDHANRVFAGEFCTPGLQDAFGRLARALPSPDLELLNAAIASVLEAQASIRPQGPETRDRAPMPSARIAGFAVASGSRQLVIVADTFDHLNELRRAYVALDGRVMFALRSEMAIAGMLYSPPRGRHAAAASLDQILLFMELNPKIDTILLSHGLCDLPMIGTYRDGSADIISAAGPSRHGKVVRIFDGADIVPVDFGRLLPGASVPDADGYFNF